MQVFSPQLYTYWCHLVDKRVRLLWVSGGCGLKGVRVGRGLGWGLGRDGVGRLGKDVGRRLGGLRVGRGGVGRNLWRGVRRKGRVHIHYRTVFTGISVDKTHNLLATLKKTLRF